MGKLLIALVLCLGLIQIIPSGSETKLHEIDSYCSFLERLAPPYVSGAYWGLLSLDCSGGMYDICKRVKPVKRTTAYRMWIGYGNWGTNNIKGSVEGFAQGKFPDLVFFNYEGKIASHVGMWRVKNTQEIEADKKLKKETKVFAEASSSKRYFKRTTIVKDDGRYKAMLGTKKLDL